MTMTYKTVTGTITLPGSDIGVRAKVIATPMTTDQALTFTGDDRYTIGPVVAETSNTGVLASFKIPTNVAVGELYWRIEAELLDRIPGAPERWTVKDAVAITGTGTALLRDLAEVNTLAVTVDLVDNISDLVLDAQAAATAAQAVGTTNDTIIAGRVNTVGSATDVALKAGYTQKPTTDLGDWALLRRNTADVTKGVAWTTGEALIARLLGWTVAPAPSGGNDQPALAALVNASTTKVLWLQSGTYLVNFAAHPVTAGSYCALALRSGQRLAGPGRDQCSIKLMNAQTVGIDTGGNAVITNRVLTGGDEGIEITGLEVDGNAANQTKNHNGIMFIRTRGASCTGVRVKNIRGVGNFPPNETFHFETQLGTDTSFINCEAVGDPGVATASGFSADNHTGVEYVNCIARGMKDGMGFTHFQCQIVSHVNCRAYSNGTHGFNSEESRSVSYTNCHAGGEAATGSTPYPIAAGTGVGNAASGFVINGTKQAVISACTSRRNIQGGLSIAEGTLGASGRIIGSYFTENDRGISAASTTTTARWYIDTSTVVSNNTTAQYDFPAALGGWISGPGTQVSPNPTQGGDAVPVTNLFPWRVSIYIVSGTPSLLRVNGADVSTSTRMIILDPGMTITVWGTYTWIWFSL